MESLNLTLKPDEVSFENQLANGDLTIKHIKIKINDEGEIEMSKEEMMQHIETLKKECRYLSTKV